MSRQCITLIGRASELTFKKFESGVTLATFTLTVEGRGQQPSSVFHCEGYGIKTARQFALMTENCQVGIFGRLSWRYDSAYDSAREVFVIDYLQYLGEPLDKTAA